MNWADRLEKDVAAKERDTEALKQEHQRDTSRLKVSGSPVQHLIVLLRSLHTCLAGWQRAHSPSHCNATLTHRLRHARPCQGGHHRREPILPTYIGLTHLSTAGCYASSSLLSVVHIWQTEILWLQACLKTFSMHNQPLGCCKHSSGL